jgi:hypothetical protein
MQPPQKNYVDPLTFIVKIQRWGLWEIIRIRLGLKDGAFIMN